MEKKQFAFTNCGWMSLENKTIMQCFDKEVRAELARVLYSAWSSLEGETFLDKFKAYMDVPGFDKFYDLMDMAENQAMTDMREEMGLNK